MRCEPCGLGEDPDVYASASVLFSRLQTGDKILFSPMHAYNSCYDVQFMPNPTVGLYVEFMEVDVLYSV